MASFHESMNIYKKQLGEGHIQVAYRGLMEYFGVLRSHFKNKYPEYDVPGGIYYGYMDMTYFPIFPESLKSLGLKIAIVFLHEAFRFEVWLSAKNKQLLTKYWELIKENNWNKYHIVPTIKGFDSIVEYILVNDPDFSDLDALTSQIASGTLDFISDVEIFLSNKSI